MCALCLMIDKMIVMLSSDMNAVCLHKLGSRSGRLASEGVLVIVWLYQLYSKNYSIMLGSFHWHWPPRHSTVFAGNANAGYYIWSATWKNLMWCWQLDFTKCNCLDSATAMRLLTMFHTLTQSPSATIMLQASITTLRYPCKSNTFAQKAI
jgi:hypothetical protein